MLKGMGKIKLGLKTLSSKVMNFHTQILSMFLCDSVQRITHTQIWLIISGYVYQYILLQNFSKQIVIQSKKALTFNMHKTVYKKGLNKKKKLGKKKL